MRVAAAHAAHTWAGLCRASSHGSGGRRTALRRANTRPSSSNPPLSRAWLGRRDAASNAPGSERVGRRAAVLVRAEADEEARVDDTDVTEGARVCVYD